MRLKCQGHSAQERCWVGSSCWALCMFFQRFRKDVQLKSLAYQRTPLMSKVCRLWNIWLVPWGEVFISLWLKETALVIGPMLSICLRLGAKLAGLVEDYYVPSMFSKVCRDYWYSNAWSQQVWGSCREASGWRRHGCSFSNRRRYKSRGISFYPIFLCSYKEIDMIQDSGSL